MALTSGTKLGPYEIRAPIGAGGMGEVYKATDTRLDRTVAIKVLPDHLWRNEELRKRFEREARAVSSLNHPNICTLHDVGRESGVDFMVMEYIDGETLADRLRKGALPLERALRHGIEIADALDKAHRQGVVHRDLKPGNVIVTKKGLKLLDFGLAKIANESAGGLHAESVVTAEKPLTETGTIMGTLQYMAPEQLEGREVDARTDVFAFGALLYEMVTGVKAFSGRSQASLISAILTSQPPAPSTLVRVAPPLLDRLIRKCLEKDPDERWQSLGDVVHLLEVITEARAEVGAASGASVTRWLPWVAAGVLLLATIVLAVDRFGGEPASPSATMRFNIVPPEGAILEPLMGDPALLALSPDGRRLVFEAKDPDGLARLWLRPLDALEARSLPGTEGGEYPFWSPDGRYIGFFAEGKLKKIEVDSGRVQTLCDAPDGKGGTWNEEGVILFSPDFESHFMRVSDAGGNAQPATSLREGSSGHYFPAFLPDGRRYLFQEIAGPETGIYVGSLDSDDARRILEYGSFSDTTSVAYASRQLLFLRGATLFAQPFDVERAELRGEPVVVAERVARIPPGRGSFTVAANGTLAYVSEGSPRTTELLWLDRRGNVTGRAGAPVPYDHVALSPDENRLAVTQWDGNWNVWLVDTARNTSTLLPGQNERHAFDVLWSPDGSQLAFSLDLTGPPNIFIVSADGSGAAERLFFSPRQTHVSDWSPDGAWIAFSQNHRETGWDFGVVPVDPPDGERVPRMLLQSKHNESAPQFSPDGRYLAYLSDESGRNELYVVRFPELDQKERISTGGGRYPRWSRAGDELFYLAPRGELMAAEVTTTPSFAASVPRPLFARSDLHVDVTGLLFGWPYDVSRDAERIVVNVIVEEPISQPITVVVDWMAELER